MTNEEFAVQAHRFRANQPHRLSAREVSQLRWVRMCTYSWVDNRESGLDKLYIEAMEQSPPRVHPGRRAGARADLPDAAGGAAPVRELAMPGRPNRSRAGPGEPDCPGCGRRAGLGTDHPGEGLCRRCGGDGARREGAGPAVEHRDRTDGRAVGVRVILLACAWQGFPFVDAWRVVCEFALHDLRRRGGQRPPPSWPGTGAAWKRRTPPPSSATPRATRRMAPATLARRGARGQPLGHADAASDGRAERPETRRAAVRLALTSALRPLPCA
jgi:hypothetical protein